MTWITPVALAVRPPGEPGARARLADDDRIGVLGDEVTNRLFLAGLDLCSALGLATDKSVRLRLEQAITELDEALKDLRHLMLAALEAQAGSGISGT
jgi:hypothetical protein